MVHLFRRYLPYGLGYHGITYFRENPMVDFVQNSRLELVSGVNPRFFRGKFCLGWQIAGLLRSSSYLDSIYLKAIEKFESGEILRYLIFRYEILIIHFRLLTCLVFD